MIVDYIERTEVIETEVKYERRRFTREEVETAIRYGLGVSDDAILEFDMGYEVDDDGEDIEYVGELVVLNKVKLTNTH